MAYFTTEFIDYLANLSRNNTREWFHANKKTHEQHVKEPFSEFVGEMIHRVSAVDPTVAIEPKDAIFRIARDIRFAKDKTPYKTWAAAVISRGGRRDNKHPAFYFMFDHQGVTIGGGMYKPDKDDIYKIRQAIQENGQQFARLLKGKKFVEVFGELQGERNKRLPKEFAIDAEQYAVIANKQFYYYAEYDDQELLLRDDLAQFLMHHYRTGARVNQFLQEAVNPKAPQS